MINQILDFEDFLDCWQVAAGLEFFFEASHHGIFDCALVHGIIRWTSGGLLVIRAFDDLGGVGTAPAAAALSA